MNENPERFWSHCGNIHRIPSRLAHNFPWKVSFQSEGFTELRNYDGCMWLKLLGHNVGGERNREGHCTITLHTCQKGFCKCQFFRVTAKYSLANLKDKFSKAIWIDIRLKNLFKPQITLPTNQDGLQCSFNYSLRTSKQPLYDLKWQMSGLHTSGLPYIH